MFETIIAALISAIAAEFVSRQSRKGSFAARAWYFVICRWNVAVRRIPAKLSDVQTQIKSLVAFLKSDQAASGISLGQFGQTIGEDGYQPVARQYRPKLYLTGLPVLVLKRHSLGLGERRLLALAEEGITTLFIDSWIKSVIVSQEKPDPIAPINQVSVIDYRHTIKGAHILHILRPESTISRTVLGRMLDPSQGMQTDSGSWKLYNSEIIVEDLWGTAYAIAFLHACIENSSSLRLSQDIISKSKDSLVKTLGWIQEQWIHNRWAYNNNKVPSERNSTVLFCEIADATIKYAPDLTNSVLESFLKFLDPADHPSSFYLNSCNVVGVCAATTRLAYSLFLGREFHPMVQSKWIELKDYAVSHIHLNHGFTSADAAMLIDMLATGAPNA